MTDGATIANVEAEFAFLGALLIDNRILDTIAAPIAPVHFFEPVHQRIMTHAVALIAAGKVANPVTVKPFVEADPDLKELGGPVYLARMTADPQGLLAPNDLAEQIIELHTRRLVRDRILDAARDCGDMNVSIPEIAATIESAAMLDTASDDGCETKSAGQFIDDLFLNYHKPTSGVTTNGKIAVVDDTIGPLAPGQMVVVAARPGMGKTAFAVSYSLGAAAAGHPTLFVSLEMRGTELAGRQLADWLFDPDSESNVPYFQIRSGFLSRAHNSAVAWAAEEITQVPLEIFDGTGVTLSRLDREIRKARRKFEAQGKTLECVFVDHIGLLQTDHRARSEYEKVSEISRTLKMLAKRHNVAMVVLCQLSRAVEQRADHRPMLSDLRDSGQIEQDADTVMFLLREAYYKKLAEPAQDDPAHEQWENEFKIIQNDLDFIVAKVRNGVTKVVKGEFFGEYQAVRG